MSRPTVSKAKTSYPIFAATFANNRPGYLVVGGGGGAGRSGVKNKISLFDFTSRAPNVEPITEVDCGDTDSVNGLASLATKDGLILYTGVNGSEEDRLNGKNEHFRSYEVKFPGNKGEKSAGNIAFLSKTTLFEPPKSTSGKKEGYQRLVRLSPPPRSGSSTMNRRIGAVASSLAGDENEIVIFNATSNKPSHQDIIGRIILHKGQEANDLDIYTTNPGAFSVAYVGDYEVFVQYVNYNFDERKPQGKNEHRKVYSIPHLDVGETKARPKLRCIRWLSPKHLLLLLNRPNRSGVDLQVLHLYEEGPASIILRKTLPKHVKAATDMDVSLLDADTSGAYQIGIGIAAIDISLSVFTMDYHGPARDSLSSFHSFNTYDNVHEVQMTKVVWSPLVKSERGPQYLRLASTSLGNTISVETFTLQPQGSRFVIQTARSRNMFTAATYLVIAMVVAVAALLVQSLLDPEGNLTKGILPTRLQNAASQHKTFGETLREKRHQIVLNNANSPVVQTAERLADLVDLHLADALSNDESDPVAPSPEQKAIVIHHDPQTGDTLSTEVHDGHEAVLHKHAQAKKWEDLSKEERKLWKKKLSDAGMWAVEEGETILKSIFFGQIGGLVGQVAQGVIA